MTEPIMIPAGYMAKRIVPPPGWLKLPDVQDISSVSSCVNEDFAEFIPFWKHNGYWFFDSPEVLQSTASENGLTLSGTSLFYYEVYEFEFGGTGWTRFSAENGLVTKVATPVDKRPLGFDVVTFWAGNSPECSPLSCNSLAETIPVNSHCLMETFDQAKLTLESGGFEAGEPGPHRIFAVYAVNWPSKDETSSM